MLGRVKRSTSRYRPPVVVLGTGGSGTRGMQRLLDSAGYFMGTNINRPGDALDIAWFIRRWVNPYLAKSRWVERMWADGEPRRFRHPGGMAADFAATVEDHREAIGRRKARWGWKVPRTILVLPFVHEFFPEMRAIHLVRDGRDMAYSPNQNQARRYAHVLDASVSELPAPSQSISFWAHVNLAAARYGERALGNRYLCLRYEEICADPAGLATRLVDFLDSPKSADAMRSAAVAEIQPSPSIGRWRQRDASEIAELERAGGEALRAFGYA